jgi:hypothetical protein
MIRLSDDFISLFTRRELEEIRGPRNRNTKILSAIILGTFIAIAFSRGGLEYLSLKMNDPFVKNLEIEIPYYKANDVDYMKYNLNSDSLKEKFRYDTVMAHVEYPLLFWNYSREDIRRAKGRSIELKNPILSQILAKRNLVHGRGFLDEFDCGLIVTEKFLHDFGYSEISQFVSMSVARADEGYFQVPVPIVAVVKELPGLASIVFTPYFYKVRTNGLDNSYNISDHRDVSFYMPITEKTEINSIKKTVEEVMKEEGSFKEYEPYIESFKDNSSYQEGSIINITFYPEPNSPEKTDELFRIVRDSERMKKYRSLMQRFYFYNFPMFPPADIAYDKMSVVFNSLKKVGDFKDYLYTAYELDIEMSKVRDKENFIAISILTYTIATMLLIFSIVSVGFFLFNLLKSHLNKIKKNLGTFQAFGMSNEALIKIYRKIIRKFFLYSIIISYCIALFINVVTVSFFLKDISFFQLINIQTALAILFMWAIIEYVFYITARSILMNTPGDLIYGRDE